jgi:hypothetical protein
MTPSPQLHLSPQARADRPRDSQRRQAWRGAAILLLGLSHCTSIGPFEGPQPSADLHAICYTKMSATPEALHELAVQICGGGEPQVKEQGVDIASCPLLVPIRLSFSCAPAP